MLTPTSLWQSKVRGVWPLHTLWVSDLLSEYTHFLSHYALLGLFVLTLTGIRQGLHEFLTERVGAVVLKDSIFSLWLIQTKQTNTHRNKQTKQTIRLSFERQNWAGRTCTLRWSQGELCGKAQASFHLPLNPSAGVIIVLLSNSMFGTGRDHPYTYINDLHVGAISILKAMEISFNSWSDWHIKAKLNPGLTTH